MSTLRVTAERLTVHAHPNADALELAQVGLYRAVIGKGQFHTGDYAVYIPESAVLPDELIEEIGLVGKLAGSKKNRVKAVRLRGELSQGIVCRPQALAGVDLTVAAAGDVDFAEQLGITKWIPEVPVSMSGEAMAAGDLLSWCEIENIQRYPDVFAEGEQVIATEKIHGSACLTTWIVDKSEILVSSKGLGGQHLALVESPTNLYWRAVHDYDLSGVAAAIAKELGASRVGIFGEVYGTGVQDLGYGANCRTGKPGYAVFDVKVEVDNAIRWLNSDEQLELLAAVAPDLPTVPRLYAGPFVMDDLLALATGTEQISGQHAHLREGIVIRPAVEHYSETLGGRAIIKMVSADYLTRKGGTEYE